MAKITITIEDELINGQTGASFAMQMELSDFDKALSPGLETPAIGVGYAIRALWRDGSLVSFAQQNIDALVEEAVLEVAVKQNISASVG